MKANDFLNTIIPLKKEEQLPFEFHTKAFKKGDIITKYGQIEQSIYFIQKGIVQLSIMSRDEEKIIDFFFPNSFVCSYTSFINQTKSDVELTAIIDCQVEYLSHSGLQQAYGKSLISNQLGRILTERIYIIKSEREKDFLTKSAATRYKELLERKGELLQHIPINKIAKYLGIHPESLSRIRKNIIS